jgi:DNA-binding CsgD family transcriptional regulator
MTEPTTVELTAPEEQLLALIREGLYDAEIAVRLGITNRDVKERIERIVAKLGVRDRAELRRAAPRPAEPGPPAEERPFADQLVLTRPPRGPLYPALFAVAFVAVAAFIVLAFLWPSDDAPTASVIVQAAPTVAPPPAVPLVRIGGRDMIELGPLFAAYSEGAVVRVEARENLLVIEFSGPLFIPVTVASGTDVWRLARFSTAEMALERDTPAGRIRLTIQGAHLGRGGEAIQRGVVALNQEGPTS